MFGTCVVLILPALPCTTLVLWPVDADSHTYSISHAQRRPLRRGYCFGGGGGGEGGRSSILGPVQARARCSGTKMDVVPGSHTHTSQAGTKNVHNQLGKGNKYREISGKFGAVASTAYDKYKSNR